MPPLTAPVGLLYRGRDWRSAGRQVKAVQDFTNGFSSVMEIYSSGSTVTVVLDVGFRLSPGK
jgi:hypothetical protein